MGLLGWLRVLISIHALLAESDLAGPSGPAFLYNFYPRSPCGERPASLYSVALKGQISIHALLAESDPPSMIREPATTGFLSTLSLRRATIALFDFPVVPVISIHALLAESDSRPKALKSRRMVFLSTLSLRRATRALRQLQSALRYFYPRSPCGERHLRVLDGSKSSIISIHALLAESDVHYDNYNLHCVISIHALLAESDTINIQRPTAKNDFYPRSPCGERLLQS